MGSALRYKDARVLSIKSTICKTQDMFVFKDVFLNLRGWWLYVDMLEQWSRIKRHLGMDAPYSLPTFHSLLQTFNDVPRKFSENPTTRSLQEWIDIGIVRPRLFPACRSNCETSKQPIMHCRWAGCFQFFCFTAEHRSGVLNRKPPKLAWKNWSNLIFPYFLPVHGTCNPTSPFAPCIGCLLKRGLICQLFLEGML